MSLRRRYCALDLDGLWDVTRRVFFTLTFLSLLFAKSLHLFAHLRSLTLGRWILWGPTFFFQDVLLIILTRIATKRMPLRALAAASALIVVPFSLLMSGMAAANTSFYVTTHAEIHWRQAKTFHPDSAAIATLLTGLTGFLIVEAILIVAAWLLSRPIHRVTGGILYILGGPFRFCMARIRGRRQRSGPLPDPELYEQIAVDDYHDDKSDDEGEGGEGLLQRNGDVETAAWGSPMRRKFWQNRELWKQVAVWLPLTLLVIFRIARPPLPSYWLLSGALPITPFTEGNNRNSPVDAAVLPGHYAYLDGATALGPPPKWNWLANDVPGFRDFDPAHPHPHYDPDSDPLFISNMDQPVLEPLRESLANGSAQIKNIILLKLESTRGDVFPLQKNEYMYNRIADSHKDKKVPASVQDTIANLTRTAEYLTGVDSGFEHKDPRPWTRPYYGGVHAKNAHTSGTYTLKSLVGTLCGVTPQVVDYNREYEHHIYQPCMAQVLDALSRVSDVQDPPNPQDFKTWPWHSAWMQSVTDTYDHQDVLTPLLGYHDVQTKESIADSKAKHYPPHGKEVNYYGYADTELREYVRDALDDAARDHKRLFLTHLTGTTHHPWGLPDDNFSSILGSSWGGSNDDLNRYLNTIGFVDDWLAEILDILQEKGVADETLLVMAGDHGLSLPNDGGVTPYDNPHIGNFHIPIVLAHPKLPPVQIETPVMSDQIVPTILDLLVESQSLGTQGKQAARDMQKQYEGQSMIRSLVPEKGGMQDWQFTVMNTGGSEVAVRSAARPDYRVVIPLIDDLEWRFTHVGEDPYEQHAMKDFNLVDLAKTLEKKYGKDVVNWLRDAAHITEWWVMDNWRRYEFNKEEDDKKKEKGE